MYTTVNMLILQARLRLADTVEKEDVDEGMRLLEMSKKSLYDEEHFNTRCAIHVHVLIYVRSSQLHCTSSVIIHVITVYM